MKEEVMEVGIDEIKADPNNIRKGHDKEKLQELADSIKNQGVINPPEIDENNTIITGESRWRAAKRAGLKEIIVQRRSGLSKIERIVRQFHENEHQQGLDRVDLTKLFKYLKNNLERTGKRGQIPIQKTMAKLLSVSETWISQKMKLENDAPVDIKILVDKNKVPETKVIKILSLPANERNVKFDELRAEAKVRKHRQPRPKTRDARIKSLTVYVTMRLNLLKAFFDSANPMTKEDANIIKAEFDKSVIPFYNQVAKKIK